MWDTTVPVIGLTMRAKLLSEMPAVDLPEGISARFYQPGDETLWAELWVSAGGIRSVEDGIQKFRDEFPDSNEAAERVMFLTENGRAFATATAWYGKDGPAGEEARLHWVCVDAAFQGRGLSAALISQALRRAEQLGHRSVYLATLTPCWVAIRMYHRFGFRADIPDEKGLEGWKIVSEKTGIDFIGDAFSRF